jgi:uncharacterized protein YifE (UPF0438 family)
MEINYGNYKREVIASSDYTIRSSQVFVRSSQVFETLQWHPKKNLMDEILQ